MTTQTPRHENITPEHAVRFLNQSTFGANQTSIDELIELGSYERWIDDQFARPASLTLPFTQENSNGSDTYARHSVWWTNAISGEDQLRQRLAFALSEIFVVSDRDYELANQQYGISHFYDMLGSYASGNFFDLLHAVALHPVMGTYLGHVRNEPADPKRNVRPDENFARELLQLFTIGLTELNLDGSPVLNNEQAVPAYDEQTVAELARVFTGWNFAESRFWDDTSVPGDPFVVPMTGWADHHDHGAKEILGHHALPQGLTPDEDARRSLTIIFEHPNVGPFIGKALIQRFVTSNPPPVYVKRVAEVFEDNGHGIRGDLVAVTKAILLDPYAHNGHANDPTRFGKMKEPMLRLTQLWRAFDAQPGQDADGVHATYARPVRFLDDVLGQAPMRSRSVFNFFQPHHPLQHGSKLVSPELQILADIEVATTNNMLFDAIQVDHNRDDSENRRNVTKVQIDREIKLAEDPRALLDHLDLILTARTLPAAFIDVVIDHISTFPGDAEGLTNRAVDAMYAVVGSPFHLVQK